MRLFIGIDLPEHVRSGILSVYSMLPRGWGCDFPPNRLLPLENLHVTIKFVGELTEQQVPALCARLKDCIAPKPFELAADRVECLPERGPVRILSAGLSGELDRLHQLHGAIDLACEPFGVARDRRVFRPHITFARLRSPLQSSVRRSIESIPLRQAATRPFEVGAFVLFQSHLEPQGPRYVPLARFSP
jgi:RNA 2',3'-cyclic 3'-phosphodiesterase